MDVDEPTSNCSLAEIAFKWLYRCAILDNLHKQCQQYENQISDSKMKEKRLYRIMFAIDVGELLDFHVQLGNVVCNQYEKANEIFREACFVCIQTLNWIPEIMSKNQIDLKIKYSSIPRFISCSSVFALRRELLESGSQTMPLFCTVGIVTGTTLRTSYTRTTWFQCINVTCHNSSPGNGCTGCPNNTEGWQALRDMTCTECGEAVEEDISCRVLGEKCLIRVVCPDGLSHNALPSKKSPLNRPIEVYVRDELIDEVELGACYSFSLIPHRKFVGGQNSRQLNLVFEANNATKVNDYPVLSALPRFWSKPNSKFGAIQQIYEDCNQSPWRFAAYLAYYFGESHLSIEEYPVPNPRR